MIKHAELKSYEYCGIKVMVKIDFDNERISLVERDLDRSGGYNNMVTTLKPKQWIFVKRGLEYMNGWRNILEAMKYAIDQAEAELRDYLVAVEKAKHDEVAEVLMEATGLVKNRKLKTIKKKK